MTIKILKENIDSGVRKSLNECPIANSISSMGYQPYVVSGRFIRINSIRYKGINEAEQDRIDKFIDEFDKGKKVKPTVFKLRTIK